MGAGFWLTELQLLRAKAEELAKAQYARRKNAEDAALMYMALGKKPLLQVPAHPVDSLEAILRLSTVSKLQQECRRTSSVSQK